MNRSVEEEVLLDELRRVAAGRTTSKMLSVALELDLFNRLRGGGATLEELAARLSLPAPSARMLGQFLCKEGFLRWHEGRLTNAPVVEAFLTGESIDRREIETIARFDLPEEALKARLLDPPPLHWHQLRRSGDITDPSSMVGQNQEGWLARFLLGLNVRRLRWGQELAERYDFSHHRRLLDVGGASGGWCIGIRKTNPQLECIVFDLPQARAAAQESLAAAGETAAIRFVEGSFFADELPPGADVALLANILHNWTPEDDREILARVLKALEPGGVLLVKESYFEDDWTGPAEAVFEAFLMIGREGMSGWQPAYGEMEAMLREAGYTDVERRFGLVLGKKPAA